LHDTTSFGVDRYYLIILLPTWQLRKRGQIYFPFFLASLRLQFFPLTHTDSGLTEDARQEFSPDVGLMRIRNTHGDVTMDHKLVFATGVRTIKSEIPEASQEVYSF